MNDRDPKNGGLLERIFHVRAAGSTPAREVLGGVATFLTLAYILFVNPAILAATGMPLAGAVVATALSAAFATLVMGLFANYPVALAPGMGLNAFFAFTVVFAFVAFLAMSVLRKCPNQSKQIPASLRMQTFRWERC